ALALPERTVAGPAQLGRRKPAVFRLQLLQAHDIGRFPREPLQQVRQPRANAVHVERREPDGEVPGKGKKGGSARRERRSRRRILSARRSSIPSCWDKVYMTG